MATMTKGNISIATNDSWSHNALTRGKIGTITNNSANTIIITSLTFQFGSGIGKFWDQESQQLQSQSRSGETITTMTLLIESGDGTTWQSQTYKNGITSSFKDSSGATIQLNADSNGAYGYIPQETRKKMPAHTFTFTSAPEIPANATYTIYFRIPAPLNGNPQPVLIFHKDGTPAGTWNSIVSYDSGGRGSAPADQTKIWNVDLNVKPIMKPNASNRDGYTVIFDYNYIKEGATESEKVEYQTAKLYEQQSWMDSKGDTYQEQDRYTPNTLYTRDEGDILTAVWEGTQQPIRVITPGSRPDTSETFDIKYKLTENDTDFYLDTDYTKTTHWTGGRWYDEDWNYYSDGDSFIPQKDTTLTRIWVMAGADGYHEMIAAPERDPKPLYHKIVLHDDNDNIFTTQTISDTINYRFDGWKKDGTTYVYSPTKTYRGGNATFIGQWTEIITEETFTDFYTPSKTGYTFIEWRRDSINGNKFTFPYNPANDENEIHVYAVWELNEYTITYKPGRDSIEQDAEYYQTVRHGDEITLLNEGTFSRNGYNLAGWSTSPASGFGTNYALNTKYTFSANTTLYPRWNKTYYEMKIDPYEVEGLTISTPQTQKAPWGIIRSLSATLKEGYTFVKWDFNPKTDIDSLTTLNATFTMPQYNIVITPIVELSGIVRIYVKDEGWKMALPYIYDKTGWKRTIPYVYSDNDNDWTPTC